MQLISGDLPKKVDSQGSPPFRQTRRAPQRTSGVTSFHAVFQYLEPAWPGMPAVVVVHSLKYAAYQGWANSVPSLAYFLLFFSTLWNQLHLQSSHDRGRDGPRSACAVIAIKNSIIRAVIAYVDDSLPRKCITALSAGTADPGLRRPMQRTQKVIFLRAALPDLSSAGLIELSERIAHDPVRQYKGWTDIALFCVIRLPMFNYGL